MVKPTTALWSGARTERHGEIGSVGIDAKDGVGGGTIGVRMRPTRAPISLPSGRLQKSPPPLARGGFRLLGFARCTNRRSSCLFGRDKR